MSNWAPRVSSRHLIARIPTRSTTPTKSLSTPDRQLHDQRARPEPVGDHRDAAREIGADPIHLVDEADPRHAVFVGLAPHRLGLRLDPGDRVEDRDRAVEHAQAALDLDREIDMAGRVDDVDAVIVPKAGRRGRGDRDAALLLLLHPIHRGGALMHFADFVGAAGVIEDPLGRRRLAGIDMRHDADIAIPLEGCLSCHERSSDGAAVTRGRPML